MKRFALFQLLLLVFSWEGIAATSPSTPTPLTDEQATKIYVDTLKTLKIPRKSDDVIKLMKQKSESGQDLKFRFFQRRQGVHLPDIDMDGISGKILSIYDTQLREKAMAHAKNVDEKNLPVVPRHKREDIIKIAETFLRAVGTRLAKFPEVG
jgi:hypothetical protein